MTGNAPDRDFDARVGPHRDELRAHCYRMLGSLEDADDALQEALIGAWRGLDGFEGRASLRAWLYRCATHACFHVSKRRPRRQLAIEYTDPSASIELDPTIEEPIWLEPFPLDAGASYEQRESVELAFVAALQHLPPTQRAALLLHEVLGFEATEVASALGTTVAAVNSALQRARKTMSERGPAASQQAALRELGEEGQRRLLTALVEAWGRSDVDALVRLLTDDVRFSMPPFPTWFAGRETVARFLRERVFATRWRAVPTEASGQLALACYQGPGFHLGALQVVTVRGSLVAEMTAFLDPRVQAHFLLPDR